MANVNAETPFRENVIKFLKKEAIDYGNQLLLLAMEVGLTDEELYATVALGAERMQGRYGVDHKYRAVFEAQALRAVGLVGVA